MSMEFFLLGRGCYCITFFFQQCWAHLCLYTVGSYASLCVHLSVHLGCAPLTCHGVQGGPMWGCKYLLGASCKSASQSWLVVSLGIISRCAHFNVKLLHFKWDGTIPSKTRPHVLPNPPQWTSVCNTMKDFSSPPHSLRSPRLVTETMSYCKYPMIIAYSMDIWSIFLGCPIIS